MLFVFLMRWVVFGSCRGGEWLFGKVVRGLSRREMGCG